MVGLRQIGSNSAAADVDQANSATADVDQANSAAADVDQALSTQRLHIHKTITVYMKQITNEKRHLTGILYMTNGYIQQIS